MPIQPLTPSHSRTATQTASAVFLGHGQVELREIAMPTPGPGQVRVRLEGCGICASSLPIWEGRPWFHYPREPGEPGHEGWGRIDAVGHGVSRLKEGDRVTFLSQRAFAFHEVVPASAAVQLPANLDSYPVPGEALGCAMNIFRRSQIRPGQLVAVVGAGFLGSILIFLAARAGARVVAVSRRLHSLSVAREMGADWVIPAPSLPSAVEQIRALANGGLCDRVIEATGKQEALDLATAITREGGRLMIAGYHQDGSRQVDMQLWNWRGMDVINAHERDPEICVRGVSNAVLALAVGWLRPWPLFTHRFALADLREAMHLAHERPAGFVKALILMDPLRAERHEPQTSQKNLDDGRHPGRSVDLCA